MRRYEDGSLLTLGTVAVLALAGAAAHAPAIYGQRVGASNTMTLFHGTKGNFAAFELDHPNRMDFGWLGKGVYLTDSKELAKVYANVKRGSDAPRILHVEVDEGRFYEASIEDKWRISMEGPQAAREFSERLMKEGYIGARLDHTPNGFEYVVFDPLRVRIVGSETVKPYGRRRGSRAMLEPRELPRDMKIEVRVTRVGRRAYVEIYATGDQIAAGAWPLRANDTKVLGLLRMESNAAHPDILEVSETEARIDGLGPLLYDIGLELANRLGMRGVAPDQSEISEEAASVWAYYYNRRGPGRVAEQKVVTSSTLPRDFREDDEDEERDDIYDESRFRSALKSVYTKPSVTVLPQLERMGMLTMVEGGMNLRGSANARNAFGPRQPLGIHGLTYRVKQDSNGNTLLAIYSGSTRIAHIDAYWEYSMRSIESKEQEVIRRENRGVACASDLRKLGAEGKYPNVIAIHHAYITDDAWKGKGVGLAMYEALLAAAFDVRESRIGGQPGPMFAVPMSCLSVGTTSSQAMRVWASLARRYPSSGTAIRVDTRPAVGTANRIR